MTEKEETTMIIQTTTTDETEPTAQTEMCMFIIDTTDTTNQTTVPDTDPETTAITVEEDINVESIGTAEGQGLPHQVG